MEMLEQYRGMNDIEE